MVEKFLQSLGIVKDVFKPMIVFSDSQFGTIYEKNLKYHGRSKHIDTKNNFIRDIIAQKEIILNIYRHVKWFLIYS